MAARAERLAWRDAGRRKVGLSDLKI